MFGYLTADLSLLSEEELRRYKACYCGLCRCLGEDHGQLSRLSLNYDMTFLVLLLSSLYEPEERSGESRCLPHPVHPRAWWNNEATAYAADMNLALAYHKCRDDWDDELKLSSRVAAAALKGRYKQIEQRHPRQCAAIEESMKELHRLENSADGDADACAASFGKLMGEILVWKEDRWSDCLRAMGMALGSFIYIMDACMDMERDEKTGSFNPFLGRSLPEDREGWFREILTMLLGECLYHFDRLPLVQDADIMKNILCAGLWAQFDKKFEKKDSSDVSGSL